MNIGETAWQIVATGLLGDSQTDARGSLTKLLETAQHLWPQIIHLADDEFVSPGLWKALANKRLDAFLPDDPAQYLGAMYDMNQTRNAALKAQLDELIRACNAVGITPGLIKGAAHLKTDLYGDMGVRLMTDLDLVIETEHVDEIVKALEAIGYGSLPDRDSDKSDHHHLSAFFRAGEYGSVEVHKEPMNLEARPYLGADELWQESVECRDGGLRYRVPSATHSMLIAVVHSEVADKNLRKLRVSLRCLQDVVAMISAHGDRVDWPEIGQRMQRLGHGGVFRDFLFALERLSGLRPLPELRFGLRSRARYSACRLARRYSAVRTWLIRIHDMSAYRIGQRFGTGQTFLSRNQNRLRVIGSFISRHIGSEKDSR